jgi:hypothetical protein
LLQEEISTIKRAKFTDGTYEELFKQQFIEYLGYQ